jgi:hypothetical protein
MKPPDVLPAAAGPGVVVPSRRRRHHQPHLDRLKEVVVTGAVTPDFVATA